MVSAANAIAAEAGREMLRAGGSAIDAAIATQLVLNIVEPQSSGLGGGAFILYWDKAKAELKVYDGRETAPASARPDRFLVNGKPMPFNDAVLSGLSIGVPGLVRLLEDVHKRYGKLPWARLFEPAIRVAEHGFEISQRLHFLLRLDGAGEFRAGGAALLLHARRQRPAHGASAEEPGVRGDAACHCSGRRRCVLRGSDRAGDRRCGGSGADRARRHDARRSQELYGERACAAVRHLPGPRGLRCRARLRRAARPSPRR